MQYMSLKIKRVHSHLAEEEGCLSTSEEMPKIITFHSNHVTLVKIQLKKEVDSLSSLQIVRATLSKLYPALLCPMNVIKAQNPFQVVVQYAAFVPNSQHNLLLINDTKFQNNSAYYGGGITYSSAYVSDNQTRTQQI